MVSPASYCFKVSVALVRLELTILTALGFESNVYTIPPQSHGAGKGGVPRPGGSLSRQYLVYQVDRSLSRATNKFS